jgi:hypothetical protein
MHTMIEDVVVGHRPADLNVHPDRWMPLYKDPTPCQTCEALARTVMMDQTAHDTTPPAPPAPVQPEGWKLVPVEPTREMWIAVNKLDDQMAAGNYDGKGCSIEQAWDCLLDAAPTPPAAQRTWVGLTDEDKLTVRRMPWETLGDLMDNTEAKLKEKNT